MRFYEIFDRPVKSEPAAHRSRSRFAAQAGGHDLEVFFKNTKQGLEINFSVDGRGFALEKDRGKKSSQQALMAAINVILKRLPEAVAYFKPKRVWYKALSMTPSRVKLYNRLLPVIQRTLGPGWRASTEQHPGWTFYYLDRQEKIKEAQKFTKDYQGLGMGLEEIDDELILHAMAGGNEVGHVIFVKQGKDLYPEDLEVDERFRGQGIARVMYDFVKSLGYTIHRSDQQTPDGEAFWDKYRPERGAVWESELTETRIPRAIEEFLDSLVPSDCGVEEIGPYRIHFEGFTSECKSSKEYRRDPEAVYQQVYRDFIQREGGAQPLVQDMVGDERFPILYSIFKKKSISESVKAYHGTFQPTLSQFKALSHFGTLKAAQDRLQDKGRRERIKDPGRIYEVVLDIKNPFVAKDFAGVHSPTHFAFDLNSKKLISQEEMLTITKLAGNEVAQTKLLVKKLKELGFDSIAYKNKHEDKGSTSYVILDPEQVISVRPITV